MEYQVLPVAARQREQPLRRFPEFPSPRKAREEMLRDPRLPDIGAAQRARHRSDGPRIPTVADRRQDRLGEISRRTEEASEGEGDPLVRSRSVPERLLHL